MAADIDFIAELIRSSFVELKDVISDCSESKEEAEAMSQEAERVVVSMIAMIAVKNHSLDEKEAQLLVSLLQLDHLPGGVIRYVNEYASRWPVLSNRVPSFYLAAIRSHPHHDSHNATHLRCLIQKIGNTVAYADGGFDREESAVVRNYLQFLEAVQPGSG